MYDPKNSFIAIFPSTDKKAMIDSVERMMYVALILKRNYIRLAVSATGLANCRQSAIDQMKEIFPDDKYRYAFWVDSDIIIDEKPEVIAKYILEAEEKGLSFSANYDGLELSSNSTYGTVFPYSESKEKLPYIPDEELKKHKPFELKLGHAGLGLAYVYTPLDFQFHTTAHELDDYPFYVENRDVIDLRYVPIKNRHVKTIMLESA